MLAPAASSGQGREVLWGLGTGLEVLWYALALASVAVFAYGVWRPIRRYRAAPRTALPPRGELPGRIRDAARIVAAQSSVARRDPLAGWAHRGVFYGFVVLFIGTTILAVDTDITGRLFGWHFWNGWFYDVYSIVLDLFGLGLLVGVGVLAYRRGVLRPGRMTHRRGDAIVIAALLYLAVTGFLLEGVRIAMDDPGSGGWQPVGWLTGQALSPIPDGALDTLRHVTWWSHGLVAIIAVAAIPYTKATHMLQGFVALVLRDDRAGKALRPIDPDRAEEPAGYGTADDIWALHLIELDACTRCGRCHDACPANATGKPLSPRDVVLDLQALALRGDGASITDVIGPETFWSCMQCNACVEICPVGIQQAPIINQVRRRLVEDGELDANLQRTLQVIHKSGNSFGENKRKRGRWTRELDFEVKDARKEPVDVLWFVGDYASFDPRSQTGVRALARILRASGVDFGILYDGERNAGNDVRRVGEEGLFEGLAEANIAALGGCDFQRIVTTDPHSLNTLRNEYPQLGGSWPVLHHTELLLELLGEGRLDVAGRLSYRVTYHDPCYLGRHNGVYEPPRALLRALGCELVEMPRNRDNSFCCGAGGGRIWIPDAPGAERPSEARIREAAALQDVPVFVVACPKDATMFEDAVKTSGNAGRLVVRELCELVEEALAAPAQAAPTPQPIHT